MEANLVDCWLVCESIGHVLVYSTAKEESN